MLILQKSGILQQQQFKGNFDMLLSELQYDKNILDMNSPLAFSKGVTMRSLVLCAAKYKQLAATSKVWELLIKEAITDDMGFALPSPIVFKRVINLDTYDAVVQLDSHIAIEYDGNSYSFILGKMFEYLDTPIELGKCTIHKNDFTKDPMVSLKNNPLECSADYTIFDIINAFTSDVVISNQLEFKDMEPRLKPQKYVPINRFV